MLVGDPQQLNPVILLGETDNAQLRRRYHITDEYDYRKNSIYKTYLACDSVSDEILLSDTKNLERLHTSEDDDLYELVEYIRRNGESKVTQKQANSRALGVKPFSTATEEAFLENLSHALENIWMSHSRYNIHKEVPIS